MILRIASTFTDAVGKLQNKEQKQVKITVFDFQTEEGLKSLRFHRLNNPRDDRFRSVSVNMDLRIIVHQMDGANLLCYVDHHDKAYAWAERRKLEVHPKTGAAQIVEVVERVEEVAGEGPRLARSASAAPGRPLPYSRSEPNAAPQRFPLRDYTSDWLLEYGVPAEWIARLQAANEDQLLELAMHLPEEAAEIVLTIATGKVPDRPAPAPAESSADPFDHPDAQRRFRRIDSRAEMEAALDAPFDAWRIFLHPSQRALVEKRYNGPARVAGSAGTGKTIVGIHRAAHVVRHDPEANVLLTTFSRALANALHQTFRRLIRHEPQLMERVKIEPLDEVARRLYSRRGGPAEIIDVAALRELVLAKAHHLDTGVPNEFVWREWTQVVDAWQLHTWDDYETVPRVGRGVPLNSAKRKHLWEVFAAVREALAARGKTTLDAAYGYLAAHFAEGANRSPYTHFIVDEAQDLSVAQVRLLAAMAGDRPDALYFAGDLGQRIFQAPFSWSSLGVNVRGRSKTLRINYRTSHQIRSQADRLLDPEIADVDGNLERRDEAQSVFNGPAPRIERASTEPEEASLVGDWIAARRAEGIAEAEIAVFVRSERELPRARLAAGVANVRVCELDQNLQTRDGCITIGTMHLAKGLEFKAVAVMAVDENVIPDLTRLEQLGHIEDVYQTERHLLYVACTRARDRLLITCAGEPSEFIEDLVG